ncbi:Putative amidase domain [Chlamydia abortus]|uniref:Amidase domain-containing protein n=1 Tax=Paenibacillus residui TaxID=629724 RepID=A0ABW3DD33_9BACL|nr:amidase domain-containing protein [Paenibacillus sp. 32O-W]SHE12734.1 Putative amidase domain [Chlamydia abortus]
MSWKSVIYEYVDRRNRMELDYSVKPVLPYLWDEEYLDKLSKHMRRLAAVHRERGLAPVQSETRVKLIYSQEIEGIVTADVELRRSFEYDVLNRRQKEERIERERLSLRQRGSHWIISRVERPPSSEHEPGSGRVEYAVNPYMGDWEAVSQPEDSAYALIAGMKTCSMPYLNREIFPAQRMSHRVAPYDRAQAVRYADMWWDSYNPEYLAFDVNCTNYVSQCLFAGGAPMNYTGKRESGWWYRGKSGKQENWSFSWAVSNSLQQHLHSSKAGLRGIRVASPKQLQLGDVICYDWDGNGRFQHTTIVTAFSADGSPLVNAQTVNSKHRYWDYRDSYAWTDRTDYRLYHIPDWL